MKYTPLRDGWHVSAVSGPTPTGVAGTLVPATVPGVVHLDLIRAGLIDAPFDGDNEAAQQWIGSTVWRYETDFVWDGDGCAMHDLVAQGLDTVATIELNGAAVGHAENQHRSYRFDVHDLLVAGRNTLVITFEAPVETAEALSTKYGALPHTSHHPYNTLRKMACNFGWDWGIDVATSGIWKPIGIQSWDGARIASVRPLVGVEAENGVLTAHVQLARERGSDAAVQVAVEVGGSSESVVVEAGQTSAVVRMCVPEVHLWWPIGHGDQPLYDVTVRSTVDSATDQWSGRVGFRTVELDTAPDAQGTPFVLVVNGERLQIRGANWIPDHAFLTEVDRDRYARRITDAVEANMNLLRVWGGGVYESEDFYTECDERGVLVWQDFLFACAAYAEEQWLSVEVEAEAREAITRLSAHASLVIWNGNNENIWGYVQWGWRARLGDHTWGNGYYRELLPRLVAELDPTRPYSPGSPYSFTEYLHPNDQHNGTMHVWDVWNTRDYAAYRDYTPRFVSEFGFQGPPAWSTMVEVVHDEPLDPFGADMLVHQKATDGNLKLARGLEGHLPQPQTIEDWHWATQLNQAHAVRFGVEHFRSLAPCNSGMIVWQLNDNWPVVSWAAVDFNEHRKPLWFALRDAYRPRLATFQPRNGQLVLVLLNDTHEAWSGTVHVRRRAFDGSVLAAEKIEASVSARSSISVALPPDLVTARVPTAEIIVADVGDERSGFTRAIWDFLEVIDQDLDPEALHAEVTQVAGGYQVIVTARSYVRDVTLQVDRVDPRATVTDALVTLLPGEEARFDVTSAVDVDPRNFVTALVVRTANDLHAAAGQR
jgi:beta-mannosidase